MRPQLPLEDLANVGEEGVRLILKQEKTRTLRKWRRLAAEVALSKMQTPIEVLMRVMGAEEKARSRDVKTILRLIDEELAFRAPLDSAHSAGVRALIALIAAVLSLAGAIAAWVRAITLLTPVPPKNAIRVAIHPQRPFTGIST